MPVQNRCPPFARRHRFRHLPLLAAALLLALASACAVGPAPRPDPPPRPATGVEHTVERGETLWKISRAYGVSIEMIALANELDSKSRIDVGQKLFIPGATRPLDSGADARPAASRPPPRRPEPRPTPAPRRPAALPSLKAQADDAGTLEEAPATTSPTASSPARPAAPLVAAAESSQYAPLPGVEGRPLTWPVRGVLYARFGKRAESVHDGIDVAAPEGTPIRAAADGRVLFSAPQQGYGNLIIVEHEGGLLTLYAHNRENLVRDGERVRLGQVIARMGEGTATSGPYLHFEVRVGGQPKNPLDYLPPPR